MNLIETFFCNFAYIILKIVFMKNKKIKTRFCPSPTGYASIGNLRTAIFNWLFAKKHGGEFVIRIEDTDKARFVSGSEEYVIKSLEMIGIIPDDGVNVDGTAKYRQSEKDYSSHIDFLLKNNYAYMAFDSELELEEIRKKTLKISKSPFSYNSFTRNVMKNSISLSKIEVEERLGRGDKYTIRFNTPKNREIKLNDLVRGKIIFNTNNIDDKVLLKSDGTPSYFIANTIDDIDSEISHVIKGEEWLSSFPIIALLYEAFECEIPEFAHLPLLLDSKGAKISKRKASEYDFPICLLEYVDLESGEMIKGFKEMGYEPDALLNALSLLGWNSGTDKEIFSKEELINEFSLEKVNNSGARVNGDKLKWFNSYYLKNKRSSEWIIEKMNIPKKFTDSLSVDKLNIISLMVMERVVLTTELNGAMSYLYNDIDLRGEIKFKNIDEFIRVMSVFVDKDFMLNFDDIDWTPEHIRMELESISINLDTTVGKIMPMLRVALTGGESGPQLPDVMYIIGPKETKRRIDYLLHVIKELA